MRASGPPASSMNFPRTSGPNEPPPTTSTAPCAGPTFVPCAAAEAEAITNAAIVERILIDFIVVKGRVDWVGFALDSSMTFDRCENLITNYANEHESLLGGWELLAPRARILL